MTLWNWFLVGAASWVLALILKVLADVLVQRSSIAEFKDWTAAGLSGLWSATCELGLFALALWIWSATLSQCMVAAVGAGTAEVLMLLPSAVSARGKGQPTKRANLAGWKAFLVERGLLLANHVLARALLWVAMMGSGGFRAAASVFALFALTEATLAFGQAKAWDWLDRRTQVGFFAFIGAVLVTQAVLIVYWW